MTPNEAAATASLAAFTVAARELVRVNDLARLVADYQRGAAA